MKRGSSAGVGMVAAMLVLSGCSDTADTAEYCAWKSNPPRRVDYSYCDKRVPGYGSYFWQIGNGINSPGVGQTFPPGAGTWTRPPNASTARPSTNKSTISRGGLGVVGAKGASSGS